MSKFGFYVSMLVLLALMSIICICGYWLWRPYNVLDIDPLPLPVLTQSPIRSEVELQFNFIKHYDTVGVATIKLVDSYIMTLAQTKVTQPKGRHQKILKYKIPENVAPGKYFIRFTVEYKMNPLKTVIEDYCSEIFAIE